MTEKREKVTVDDIIGLIHTDETTNSVELKKDLYRDTENKRFEKFRKIPVVIEAYQTDEEMLIETLEGTMKADKGDWIIRGVKGELYPCKPDVFDMTYEKVEKNDEERSCGYCKHFQLDGMFGIWCDIHDADWSIYDGDCPNFERNR